MRTTTASTLTAMDRAEQDFFNLPRNIDSSVFMSAAVSVAAALLTSNTPLPSSDL
jgi:hypothetical protein